MRVALFDLDDTLIDRDGAFRVSIERFAEHHRLPDGAVDVIMEFNQRGMVDWPDWMAQTQARFGLLGARDELVDAQRQRFLDSFAPDPEVLQGLAALRDEGWRIAVVTNGGALVQPVKVRNAGLQDVIDALLVSEIEGLRKPDRAIFDLALSRLGGRAEDAWMIGDAPDADIRGGLAAGLRTVWVSHGLDWPHADATPHHTVPHVRAAFPLLLD